MAATAPPADVAALRFSGLPADGPDPAVAAEELIRSLADVDRVRVTAGRSAETPGLVEGEVEGPWASIYKLWHGLNHLSFGSQSVEAQILKGQSPKLAYEPASVSQSTLIDYKDLPPAIHQHRVGKASRSSSNKRSLITKAAEFEEEATSEDSKSEEEATSEDNESEEEDSDEEAAAKSQRSSTKPRSPLKKLKDAGSASVDATKAAAKKGKVISSSSSGAKGAVDATVKKSTAKAAGDKSLPGSTTKKTEPSAKSPTALSSALKKPETDSKAARLQSKPTVAPAKPKLGAATAAAASPPPKPVLPPLPSKAAPEAKNAATKRAKPLGYGKHDIIVSTTAIERKSDFTEILPHPLPSAAPPLKQTVPIRTSVAPKIGSSESSASAPAAVSVAPAASGVKPSVVLPPASRFKQEIPVIKPNSPVSSDVPKVPTRDVYATALSSAPASDTAAPVAAPFPPMAPVTKQPAAEKKYLRWYANVPISDELLNSPSCYGRTHFVAQYEGQSLEPSVSDVKTDQAVWEIAEIPVPPEGVDVFDYNTLALIAHMAPPPPVITYSAAQAQPFTPSGAPMPPASAMPSSYSQPSNFGAPMMYSGVGSFGPAVPPPVPPPVQYQPPPPPQQQQQSAWGSSYADARMQQQHQQQQQQPHHALMRSSSSSSYEYMSSLPAVSSSNYEMPPPLPPPPPPIGVPHMLPAAYSTSFASPQNWTAPPPPAPAPLSPSSATSSPTTTTTTSAPTRPMGHSQPLPASSSSSNVSDLITGKIVAIQNDYGKVYVSWSEANGQKRTAQAFFSDFKNFSPVMDMAVTFNVSRTPQGNFVITNIGRASASQFRPSSRPYSDATKIPNPIIWAPSQDRAPSLVLKGRLTSDRSNSFVVFPTSDIYDGQVPALYKKSYSVSYSNCKPGYVPAVNHVVQFEPRLDLQTSHHYAVNVSLAGFH